MERWKGQEDEGEEEEEKRRTKKLVDDLNKMRGYWKCLGKALDHTL